MDFPLGIRPSLLRPPVLDQSPIYTLQLFCLYADHQWLIRARELRLTIRALTPPYVNAKSHSRRKSHMSKSPTILWLLAALTVGGCMTEGQFLASRQPTAIQVAESRGQFEMNCPSAKGEVLSQELTQPPIQGPLVQGESRGLFTIGVAGCGQRRVYQVFCPMGGDN